MTLVILAMSHQFKELGERTPEKFSIRVSLLIPLSRANNFIKSDIYNCYSSSFITGSYDRTCKVWDTASGEELHVLEGHKNVVYAIAFNNPYG